MSRLPSIIARPVQTEKSVSQGAGVYTFIIRPDAKKTEVKAAFEKYYGVDVESVRTIITHEKYRNGARRPMVKRPVLKKAVVKTVGAKTIDLNSINVNA